MEGSPRVGEDQGEEEGTPISSSAGGSDNATFMSQLLLVEYFGHIINFGISLKPQNCHYVIAVD